MTGRKIENFIRTKYEKKRWAIDGEPTTGMFDEEGDDNVVSFWSHFTWVVADVELEAAQYSSRKGQTSERVLTTRLFILKPADTSTSKNESSHRPFRRCASTPSQAKHHRHPRFQGPTA